MSQKVTCCFRFDKGLMMVTSAQLRAARAYLGWTMDQAAEAAGLHRRTIIRLESGSYGESHPPSLMRLVAMYRQQQILLECGGLVLADAVA